MHHEKKVYPFNLKTHILNVSNWFSHCFVKLKLKQYIKTFDILMIYISKILDHN